MIVVDVETTSITKNRGVLSIGAIHFENPNDPKSRFYVECRAPEGCDIEQTAFAVNGFKPEDIFDPKKLSQDEAVRLFDAWARGKGRQFMGLNPAFDYDSLQKMYERAGMAWPFKQMLDLTSTAVAVGKQIHPTEKLLATSAVYHFVGLPDEPFPHRADRGAAWEAESFYRYWYGKCGLEEFKQWPLKEIIIKKEEVSF